MADEDSHPEDQAEAPLGLLPLDAWHRRNGARMVPFAGYEMPVQYAGQAGGVDGSGGGGIIAEHLWTRAHAGLFDVSHMGQLFISGEGAEAALESVLPIDLRTLKPSAPRYSLLLDEDGGILDDLMVTRREAGFYLVVNGATKWDDIGHLREHLPDEVTINHLEDSALLALQGPEAAQALNRLAPGVAALTFMKAGAFALGGVDAWISRSGYTGEDGFEIAIPAAAAMTVADLLCSQAEVRPIGLGARDSLRLEAGLPLYGHDLTPETGPVEAGLAFAVNKRRRLEGGFPGAKRVLRDIAAGVATTRVGLALAGRQAAREGAEVFLGLQRVGVITSGGFSPSLERPIAMAYVASQAASAGTEIEIEVRGKRLPATVVPLPFVPHRYHR